MNIYNQLMEIAAGVLEKPVDELSPDLPIEEQGADSLHIAEILLQVEDVFGIYVPDSVITEMRTLAELATWLEENG